MKSSILQSFKLKDLHCNGPEDFTLVKFDCMKKKHRITFKMRI